MATARVGITLVLGLAVASPTACQVSPDSQEFDSSPAVLLPTGVEFPYIVQPACPGEACSYSARIACDLVLLYRSPGDSFPSNIFLSPGQRFQTSSGALIVHVPEVVVVTRPVLNSGSTEDPVAFVPGDTLYVLDYESEGVFNVWHSGEITSRFSFWPSSVIDFGSDFDYRGEVIQTGVDSFWGAD